jgi:ABC-type amino acid transport substrate-binding protein
VHSLRTYEKSRLTEGVADGALDASVAALTVTVPRHRLVDFTQPFYSAGLGIAVAKDADITWLPLIGNVFSRGFLGAVVVLFVVSLGLALCCGSSSGGITTILVPIDEVWAPVFGGRRW